LKSVDPQFCPPAAGKDKSRVERDGDEFADPCISERQERIDVASFTGLGTDCAL
jgi:hypothetical protein